MAQNRWSGVRIVGRVLATASLFLVMACGGKNNSTSAPLPETVAVSGKVTYVRVPLAKDANGVPTGPETDPAKFSVLPAQGFVIRFVQKTEETQPDGTKTSVWKVVSGASQITDSTGAYSTRVPKNTPVYAELMSRVATGGQSIRILADPAGITSAVPQAERLVYTLRKGLDGSSPAGNPLPATTPTGDATVNFAVGLDDKWWLTQEAISQAGNALLETTGTGSRVLAIGDTATAFGTVYGSPTPGDTLDLHYRRGISEPKGSFIEFDTRVYPLSVEGSNSTRHFFGSIRGGQSNDDAFDEGVLLPLYARANLYSLNPSVLFPILAPLSNLTPELAVLEGLSDAMAATLLKSPYLADMTPAGVTYRDIRDITSLGTAQRTPYSAPLLAASAWAIVLKANSLPNPGVPSDWAKIDPKATARFFVTRRPLDSANLDTDLVSIYGQLARLKEGKGTNEPVDLASVFTDSVLTSLLQPFNIVWPRPTTGPYASFLLDWGADPNSLTKPIPGLTLSMAQAEQVRGSFPNASAGELAFARFTATKDTAYNLGLQAALPPEAQVEVQVDSQAYLFSASQPGPQRVVLRGNTTTPVLHRVRVRLLSPAVRQPDLQATVRLDLAP